LDYVEFLESKYAERPAGAPPFHTWAETLEGHAAAVRGPGEHIKGTMTPVGKPGKLLEKVRRRKAASGGGERRSHVDRTRIEENAPE